MTTLGYRSLLANLIAAHVSRFSLSRKKIGIFIIHSGLVLLFIGQFMTEALQVESFMTLPEGESRNYSESSRKLELAIVDPSDPKVDRVVTVVEGRGTGAG